MFFALILYVPIINSNNAGAKSKAAAATIYVLLLNPNCTQDFRDKFDYYMHLNNTENERYFGYYQVVCMSGVTSLNQVNTQVLPALRFSMPYNTFVFVYPASMKMQFEDYIGNKYGEQYRDAALGVADIGTGSAYADEEPAVIKHEMGHLAICGTWHDAQGRNLGKIVREPGVENLPWC
jgi:hypothetical protein